MDRADVAAARAARELGYVSRTDGAASMSVTDCIENEHFDTIVELSRQLRKELEVTTKMVEAKTSFTDHRTIAQLNRNDSLLALWPDGGE